MADDYNLVLSNDFDSLPALEAFLRGIAEANGWPDELLFDVNLALEEVVVNVIQHAQAAREIAVSVHAGKSAVVATVEDDGIPFNPLEVPPADIDAPVEDRPAGGLGLHLVRAVIPELGYSREGHRNRLVLRKPRT